MCQRRVTTKVTIIHTATELIKIMYQPGIIVKNIILLTDECALVSIEEPDELTQEGRFSNRVVASFVTAMGRCALFSHMIKAGKRLCYSDTGMFLCKFSSITTENSPYRLSLLH